MNFYKHFLGDYARDTAHLSMLEHGAYRLMLDHYYATGKSLPADKTLLYRVCKAASKPERAAVDLVAEAFFPVNGDGTRHNHRADRELGDAAAYADAQSKRAQKRWGNATAMPAHQSGISPDDASHSQIPEKTKVKRIVGQRPDDARKILTYLNDQAGRKFEPVPANLELILARLRESTPEQCKRVVDNRVKAWKNDPDMCQFLRPETIFKRTKFAQYVGQLDAPIPGQKAWDETWSGIVEKGISLGIEKREDESNPEFKQRVIEAAKVAA